jgi:hypothetical protein
MNTFLGSDLGKTVAICTVLIGLVVWRFVIIHKQKKANLAARKQDAEEESLVEPELPTECYRDGRCGYCDKLVKYDRQMAIRAARQGNQPENNELTHGSPPN